MVSGLLFLIGVLTVVRSRFVEHVPLDYSVKNIAVILLSLCRLRADLPLPQHDPGDHIPGVHLHLRRQVVLGGAQHQDLGGPDRWSPLASRNFLGLNLPLY
jgi:hypothetical protein